MQTIDVSEVFLGQQGEGPSLGTRALFVRLHGCPLACTWCDTKYTWDKTHPGYNDRTQHSLGGLVDRMMRTVRDDAVYPPPLVVLTGGEPLIWQSVLPEVIEQYMAEASIPTLWEIETSGSITPNDRLGIFAGGTGVRFLVSHKLTSAGNEDRMRAVRNTEALRAFVQMPTTIFKPVVDPFRDEDALFAWVEWMRDEIAWKYVCDRVYLMPRGDTREMVLDNMPGVAKLAANLGVNYTTRAHTLMYGNERGV